MSVYKPFKRKNHSITPFEVNHKLTLTSSSLGVFAQPYQSGSLEDISHNKPDISGSYWQSLRMNFYLSGSDLAMKQNTGLQGPNKYSSRTLSLAQNQTIPDYYLNKFNDSGVVISIPHEYYGLQIQRGSFKLTTGLSSVTAPPYVIDDGYGNLYAPEAERSASSATALSSSENYVGNIFYNTGIITITDTGSYKGGYGYEKFARNANGGWKVEFKSSDIIYEKEYSISINTNDYNISNNPTSRENDSDGKASEIPLSTITGSNWAPYLTTIGFYDSNYDLVMVARYPQPIKLKKNTNLTFKIKQDW